MQMVLTLVTPAKKLLEKVPSTMVRIPAHRGELEILPGHAPLITTLSAGVLTYVLKGSSEEVRVAVSWGYCEVTGAGEVNVLAEIAETKSEISLDKAKQDRSAAMEKLGKTNYEDFIDNKRDFELAEARIKAVQG
jgi:F-type H+-transporting ATPase subunit epsilon